MAKIRANELFEKEDIFEGIRQSAEKTMQTLDKIDAEFKKIGATLKKDILNANFGDAKGLKDFLKMVEKANNLQRDTIKLEKEKVIVEQQNEKLKQQKIRTQEAENRQQERINKQKQRQQKLLKDEADAYKRLVKSTRELKNESKRLGAELLNLEMSGKKNTEQYRKLEKQYNRVTKSAQKGDAQLKKLDKQVGDNFRNVGNYVGALNTLKTGLAQLGLAFGIGTIIRGGAESIIEFDQAIADLSAITGASGKDLDFYKQRAIDLGTEVEGGASAVVEAFKLIGSAKPELLENADALAELTENAIILSQASGMTLPEASKNLTDAMNQFGASSEEAGKFIDILASGSKFGSAEIPQITEALLKFGAVAKGTNVSVQESVGAIELLAEKGLKGAEAGTKLRNVMLKLSAPDALPKKAKEVIQQLGISFEELTDPSKSFEDRLKILQPLLNDNANLVKVFGLENEVAGQILLENTDRLGELTEKMDTNGVATEQAKERTNTLGHALMRLKNEFFALFQRVGSGEGTLQTFIDGLTWIANHLPQIISLLGKLIKVYVTYRVSLVAINTAQKLYSLGLTGIGREIAKQIPLTKAYAREQQNLARQQNGATKETKGFNASLVAMIVTGAITFVYNLASAWYDVASGTRNARLEQEAYNKATQRGQEKAQKFNSQARKDMEQEIRDLRKRGLSEQDFAKERDKIQQKYVDQNKQRIESLRKVQRQLKANASDLRLVNKAVQSGQAFASLEKKGLRLQKTIAGVIKSQNLQNVQAEKSNLATEGSFKRYERIAKAGVKEIETEIQSLTSAQKELSAEIDESVTSQMELQRSSYVPPKTKKDQKEFNTELSDTNEYLSRQIELLQELNEIQQERQLTSLQKDIDAEMKKQLESAKKTGKFEVDTLNQMIRNKIEMEKSFIDQRVQFEIDAIDRKIEQQEKKEMDALFKERERLLAQKGLTQKEIDKINADFDKKDDELIEQQLKRREDAELEKKIIYEKGINDKKDLDKQYVESVDEFNDQLIEKQKEFNRVVFESTNAIVKASADYFIQQSQRKIEQIEKEISEAEKQADTLRALAEQGNIDAQQSLAEQQEFIKKKNREKLEEEKRQQRIQLAQSVYSTYTAKVNSGSKNALAETIRDTQVLNQFIQSLPTFFDGTEDTGTNGRGIDGKGGFLSVLHPNERVVPKSLNDQIGSMSNDELSQLAMEYQNGKMVRADSQISSALELAVLVNRLDNLTKVIQDKPETNIELGEITQGAMEIVKSTKKGNTIVYNRYKVK